MLSNEDLQNFFCFLLGICGIAPDQFEYAFYKGHAKSCMAVRPAGSETQVYVTTSEAETLEIVRSIISDNLGKLETLPDYPQPLLEARWGLFLSRVLFDFNLTSGILFETPDEYVSVHLDPKKREVTLGGKKRGDILGGNKKFKHNITISVNNYLDADYYSYNDWLKENYDISSENYWSKFEDGRLISIKRETPLTSRKDVENLTVEDIEGHPIFGLTLQVDEPATVLAFLQSPNRKDRNIGEYLIHFVLKGDVEWGELV